MRIVNIIIGKQDCKKCMWYESCKKYLKFKQKCEDYDPLEESTIENEKYLDDLQKRQLEYIKIIKDFEDGNNT